MGMDVFGRNPSDPCGQYFRASIWMWPPIHQQMALCCGDLLSDELLIAMGYNDGAGPEGQGICSLMADRIEKSLEVHQDGFEIESDEVRVTDDGQLVGKVELAKDPTLRTISPFRASRGLVMDWIRFLRHCGGFEVW